MQTKAQGATPEDLACHAVLIPWDRGMLRGPCFFCVKKNLSTPVPLQLGQRLDEIALTSERFHYSRTLPSLSNINNVKAFGLKNLMNPSPLARLWRVEPPQIPATLWSSVSEGKTAKTSHLARKTSSCFSGCPVQWISGGRCHDVQGKPRPKPNLSSYH